MHRQITTKLHATVRGTIWMPAVECTKEITVNLTQERTRLTPNRGGSLRYMVNGVLSDGDFQSCAIDEDAVFEFTLTRRTNDREIKKTRWIPITRFPSLADCINH